MKNKFIKRRIIFGVVIILLVALLVFICFNFLNKDNGKNNENIFVSKKVELSFKNRKNDSINYFYDDEHLTVGWLQVQGTSIDYPIFSKGEESPTALNGQFGWRSNCYASSENNEFLSGHNVLNVSSTPIRDMSILTNFEALLTFTYDDFAKENLYISYTKNNEEHLYKIFAAGFYDKFEYNECSIPYENEQKIENYINEVKNNSIYNYDVDINSSDKIIALGTCTRYFGANENNMFMITAREVRENEKIETYKVSKTEKYNDLSYGVGKDVE